MSKSFYKPKGIPLVEFAFRLAFLALHFCFLLNMDDVGSISVKCYQSFLERYQINLAHDLHYLLRIISAPGAARCAMCECSSFA